LPTDGVFADDKGATALDSAINGSNPYALPDLLGDGGKIADLNGFHKTQKWARRGINHRGHDRRDLLSDKLRFADWCGDKHFATNQQLPFGCSAKSFFIS
jgi:hypothetical protein